MAAKNNIPLLFLSAIFVGSGLLFALETVLVQFLQNTNSEDLRYFGIFLREKLNNHGPDAILALVPQLKYRWLFLCLFAWWMFSNPTEAGVTNENQLRWRIRLFFVVQLLYIPDLLTEMNIRWRWASFFEPPLLPGLLLREMPPLILIQFSGLLLFGISAWLVLAKWKNGSFIPALLALLIWGIWAFLLSIYQSGGVTDHAYASLHSALFFMAVFLFIWWKFPALAGTGHRLFQAGIWGCYFFAGLEKAFLSGTDWISGRNIEMLLLHHPSGYSQWIADYPAIGSVLLLFVLLFQLLSPLQWKYPRWSYVTLTSGLLFHTGTWLILNIGGWQSPWLWMLFFLLPVDEKLVESKSPAPLKSLSGGDS